MNAAIMFTWTRPAPGREAKAMELFGEVLTSFGKLAADGKCEEPMVYGAPSGFGMMLVHGERDALHEIIGSDEFTRLYAGVTFVSPHIKFELINAGEGAQERTQAWTEAGTKLGYL